MRFHSRTTSLKFKKSAKRADKSNAIDLLCSGMVPKEGIEKEDFERHFEEVPSIFTPKERESWLSSMNGLAASSDAFVSLIAPILRILTDTDSFLSLIM